MLAPVDGTVVAMSDVPDPVFSQSIVGPGLAIDPPRAPGVLVVAPVAGRIVKLHPHAAVVQADGSRTVLVHLGLDTIELAGAGFELHATEGDDVLAGDRLVSWDPAAVESGGRSPVCPVVAVQADPAGVRTLVAPGATVRAGEPLLEWG